MILNLEIVDFTDATGWRWRLRDTRGAFIAEHQVALDDKTNEYRGFVDLYGFVRWNVAPDSREQDEPLLVERIAKWARSEVWGEVGDKVLAIAESEPVTVHVQVPTGAETLLFLPFELGLVLDSSPAALDVSLVFELGDRKAPHAKRPIGDRLRMLALFSMPTDQAALNVRRERHELGQLVHRVARAAGRAVELRILQYGVTRDLLGELLEEGEGWDLIHFSGHGLPAGLVLEREDGSADLVHSDEFADLLWPARAQLKLVTLSSCESAAAEAADTMQLLGVDSSEEHREALSRADSGIAEAPLPAVAQRLTDRLGCAALAMRYPVEDEFAINLSADLYEGLLANDQSLPRALQRALAKARGRAAGPSVAGLSLATPALFGNAALDLRMSPPPGEPTSFDASRATLASFPPEPENFVGRVGPLARASAALAPKSHFRGIIFHGMAGAGKTACALELAFRHRDRRFEAMAWYAAPSEGSAIDEALAQFTAALQVQIDGLELVHVVEDIEKLEGFLPRLRGLLADRSLLIVLDNVESLLTDDGQWRDPRWALIVEALVDHDGLSRLVMTTRIPPAGLRESPRVRVEPIHSLSANESALLARQLPNLGRLIMDGGGAPVSAGRALVRRTLEMVQGNPKLIQLADGQAADPEALEKRIAEADEAWANRDNLDAFFATGEPADEIHAEDFLRVIERWTTSITANLSEQERFAFQVLCCLEDSDRLEPLIGMVWPTLWTEQIGEEPPDPAPIFPSIARQGLIDVDSDGPVRRLGIHPAVEQAARAGIGAELQAAVDVATAGAWMAVHERAKAENDTVMVVRSGLAAAPYLVRQGDHEQAAVCLSFAISRDASVDTLAAALPQLTRAATLAKGTSAELVTSGALLRARGAQHAEGVVSEMREFVELASEKGDFNSASAILADLFAELLHAGNLKEAGEVLDLVYDVTRRGGYGPWTEMADQGMRLRLMQERGQNAEVLKEVATLKERMDSIEESDKPEVTPAWNVREVFLSVAFSAAMALRSWKEALDFNMEVQASQKSREAPPLVQATTAFNGFGPLLELGRLPEAENVLSTLRRALETAGEYRRLGDVFGSWAILETKRGNFDDAIDFEYRALRLTYQLVEPGSTSTHHHNLANHLSRAERDPKEIFAHRLAAALIGYQTGSGDYRDVYLPALAIAVRDSDAEALPKSFQELCDRLEQNEGVEFLALFERLPRAAPDGAEALSTVLGHVDALLSRAQQKAESQT